MKKGILSGLLLLLAGNLVAQQEALYTHYTLNTLAVNPAYAGSRNAMTVTALNRTQWLGFEGSPRTQTLTLHAPIANGKMGLGLSAVHDKVGPVNSTSVNGDYAYKLRFSRKSQLAFGLKAGLNSLSTNLLALNTTEIGDQAATTGQRNDISFNAGFGMYYYSDVWYLGVSAPKLIENKILSTSTSFAKESRHYYLIGGFVKKLSKQVLLKPSALVRLTAGAPVQADFTALFIIDKRLEVGGFYRTGDALGVLAGINIKESFRVGYSFDWSYGMRSGSFNSGSHEIVLRYDFIHIVKHPVISPRYF